MDCHCRSRSLFPRYFWQTNGFRARASSRRFTWKVRGISWGKGRIGVTAPQPGNITQRALLTFSLVFVIVPRQLTFVNLWSGKAGHNSGGYIFALGDIPYADPTASSNDVIASVRSSISNGL